MKRELFISKEGALKAVIKVGVKLGLPADLICSKGKVYPVIKRGQVLGYHASINTDSVGVILEGMT